ncbi:MAG: hypothetical protein ACRC0G_07580 [Fusobacteriaceae bacterium]
MFNEQDSIGIDTILGMIGGPINGINLTPFSIMSGTLVGVLKPTDNEPGALIILTSKDFTTAEELEGAEVSLEEFVGPDMVKLALGAVKVIPETKLEIEDVTCKISLSLDRDVVNGCKIILMPFSNMISEESIKTAQTNE